MALSLVSTQPIETGCGQYDVAVSLNGKQPVTTMRIFQAEAFEVRTRRRWSSTSKPSSLRPTATRAAGAK
jgi:hypothetical protein